MLMDPPSRRHVGDLGNLMTPAQGPTQVSISDSLMTFVGLRGVIGRALVIHAMIDDLGRGGVPASLTTGNAGGRLACGVIGYIAPSGLQ
ncbi:Superoxide dismutase [Cu-Zn] [Parelaphostrongylus tenuis]|uniref:Superoxide dismutase [Cu-Zn] n=1 Tax=Parelaphostrongylus tenuis TaxID=148309 RepID=A0AAD5QKF5_PARTN|nr:Superoxide dismutase [Cu-Zn] [Parelaphostrongylus tenuis]